MTHQISSGGRTALGANHGYRFDGDFVHLNAEVNFSDADLASGQQWALQLWANDGAFAGRPAGVKVAELAVQPMAGGLATAGWCTAMPPAGAGEQVVGLALVAFGADGQPLCRDLAVYPGPENFCQPALIGDVACALSDGAACLRVDAIANPRAADNLSGSLALEVWALDAPYRGGSWRGTPVATAILGTLAGGERWADCRFDVPAALPAAAGALTVMLREWTPAGYVTRDYRNIAAAARAVPVPAAKPAAKPEAIASAPAPVPAKAGVASTPAATSVKPPVSEAKAVVPEKPAVQVTAKAASGSKRSPVSINTGSESELAAIKGLSRSLAKAIVAGRPYQALEDVSKVKGMGAKTLGKLREFLAL